ncbi:MAG: iron-containing alcohol dehydrogenase, partial [Peptococcaceae bacterium]|nr:iron-containing alcohol dehydrogenase [Peptococcaceae bacterium]
AGLAVLFPAWCRYVYKKDIRKFCQAAVRIWNIDMDYENPEKTALQGIQACEEYFRSLGMPTRMDEIGVKPERVRFCEISRTMRSASSRIFSVSSVSS